MDVELLFMEMKDHWSNQSTDPEISSSPATAAITTKEEPDIVQELCQDAIKRWINRIKAAEAKQSHQGGGGLLKSTRSCCSKQRQPCF